ncbi:inactive peptidyl-prolyl cis-trans isomerase FKBP6-like [Oppia nitens]|uniref:inactive peptidyl-prolyl cis-trans isomerase FKBP6-like n=1 Tax=Oppia nitens TaxID=1686743 RepID=UPI0023DBF7B3|nr:inactive peptidyl-prolyl cis-trans isomerase FKBP6-like [Oppia nitens]
MDTKDKEVIDLSEEWDEDNDMYDVSRDMVSLPIQSKNALRDIVTDKGYEFESEESPTEEEKDEQEVYWTRDQILANLDKNPKPSDIGEDSENYDERIKFMDTIIADGVYKKLLRNGTGERINEKSAVLYNLNGYIEGQDEPFDSTWLRGRPNNHRLSHDTLLPGLYFAITSMKRGERSEFVVRPNYAYLSMGCPPRIPPDCTVLFIIEVIKVFEEGSLAHFDTIPFEERSEISFETIYKLCDEERVSANGYFKANRIRESAFRYKRAIRFLEDLTYKTNEEQKTSNELLLKLYVNIANAYNKLSKTYFAISYCKKALDIDSNNIKALYQLGLAKMCNEEYEVANRLFQKALKQKPNNTDILDIIERLDQRMNGQRIVEENLYRKMGSIFVSNNKK